MSYPEEQGAGTELFHMTGKWKIPCRTFLLRGKISPTQECTGNSSIKCRCGLMHFRHAGSHPVFLPHVLSQESTRGCAPSEGGCKPRKGRTETPGSSRCSTGERRRFPQQTQSAGVHGPSTAIAFTGPRTCSSEQNMELIGS